MDFNSIKQGATMIIGRTGLQLQKFSPQILIGLGVLGAAGSTYLACKATYDGLGKILTNSEILIANVKANKENDPNCYTDQTYRQALAAVYLNRIFNVAKLYAPSVVLGAVSIGMIVGGERILTKRNAVLMAAYQAVQKGYNEYRQHVIAEYGEETDIRYRKDILGGNPDAMTILDPEDKTGNKVIERPYETDKLYSEYAKFFDEMSPYWKREFGLNLWFVQQQQRYANEKLNAQGFLFLNDVYESLGIPKTPAGQVVGWVKNTNTGDDFVSFKMEEREDPDGRDFINGYNPSILLDFNVQGVIYELI